jgi:AraC family transcriptional regulator
MPAKVQDLQNIRRIVGAVTKEELRYVDCFVADGVGLFMPVGGACFYALTPEHSHPAYMFVLHFDDRTSVKMDGRTVTGTHGTVFALSPGILHQELPSDAPPRYICIMIGPRLFERQYRSYSRKKPVFRGDVLPAGRDLLPLLKRFMIEAASGMPGSDAVRDALGVEICHSLIRSFTGAALPGERIAERVEVNRAVEHLHANLNQKVTVENLAEVAHLSPSHFARVFRKETGKAPMEYVHGLRIERAKKLLLAGDKTITEIALECGFGSSSYLSTCFQKECRMTPREYQRGMAGAGESKARRR